MDPVYQFGEVEVRSAERRILVSGHPVSVGTRGLDLLLVWCAALFCTYLETAAKAALARVTLARMSEALAVQMKGLGLRLCWAM